MNGQSAADEPEDSDECLAMMLIRRWEMHRQRGHYAVAERVLDALRELAALPPQRSGQADVLGPEKEKTHE